MLEDVIVSRRVKVVMITCVHLYESPCNMCHLYEQDAAKQGLFTLTGNVVIRLQTSLPH